MAERPIVITQALECRYPSVSYFGGMPSFALRAWTKSFRAEGQTEKQVSERLNQKIDQYYKEQDEDLPPTPLYYAIFGCRRVGEPIIEKKLTLWDSCRRFLFRIGA